MCMCMWAVSVVYNLLHVAHVLLWNLTVSVCLTKGTALACKYPLLISKSSCLHQCYHHTPEWAPRDTSGLFQIFLAAFVLLYRHCHPVLKAAFSSQRQKSAQGHRLPWLLCFPGLSLWFQTSPWSTSDGVWIPAAGECTVCVISPTLCHNHEEQGLRIALGNI